MYFMKNDNHSFFISLAKSQKTDKFEDQDLKFLTQNKKIIKILIAIVTSLIFIIVTTVVVIELNKHSDEKGIVELPHKGETENLKRHQILSKKDWLGRDPKKYVNITTPVSMVIIKHTGGGTCFDFQTCAGKVQTIQGANIADGFDDIYCNFLIGGDGNIYVGRGWDVRNAHRDSTIDIVYMGNFDVDVFTETMSEAGQLLIEDGAKKNKISLDYKVVCHNQTAGQRSPGQNVFKEVVKWKHYDSGLYFNNHLVSQALKKTTAHTNQARTMHMLY